MKPYFLPPGAGLAVSVAHGRLNVRSPAAPVPALFGLPTILSGQQAVPVTKRGPAEHSVSPPLPRNKCVEYLSGRLSGHNNGDAAG
ncbi:DUF1427 family protein [Pseudoroseomonas globiformis]|uniref:DUF1427 family protein n=1 Tax=Teichococcus globiformis TaxID=2307229 RepID=A0ABV7FZZ5_9PROT